VFLLNLNKFTGNLEIEYEKLNKQTIQDFEIFINTYKQTTQNILFEKNVPLKILLFRIFLYDLFKIRNICIILCLTMFFSTIISLLFFILKKVILTNIN